MLAFLAPFFQLINGIIGYFRQKKLEERIAAETQVRSLREQLHDLQKANQARDAIRAAVAANPGLLRAPDPDSRD